MDAVNLFQIGLSMWGISDPSIWNVYTFVAAFYLIHFEVQLFYQHVLSSKFIECSHS